MLLLRMSGSEGGLSLEHRAGDGEQAVRDRAQSPAVAVSAGAEGGVLGLADGVMLDGDPCPVVDCIAEARMGCEAANDDHGFAGSPRDGSDSAQAPQRLVVAPLQGVGGLGEQRGEDGLADSGQGGEDRHVALPAGLSSAVIPVVQGFKQALDFPFGLHELTLDEAEALGGAADVSHRGLGRSGRDGDRWHTKDFHQLICGDPPDPMALEDAIEGLAPDAPGLGGRRHARPQLEEPGLGDAVRAASRIWG